MKPLTKLDDSTLYSIDPADADVGWEILRRPQTMRVVPAIANQKDLAKRIESALASGGGAFVVVGDPNSYPGGILLYETVAIDGEGLQVLTFSFDRCLSGREWAQKCIAWLNPQLPIQDRAILIGSSMSNSERLAKAVGLKHAGEANLNGDSIRLFQHQPHR